MTETQKDKRYCIPCGTQGNHTSMDHTACPTKREIIRGRTLDARTKRNEETQNNKRDLDLITKVFDYTNTEAWPKLQHNPDQTKVSTIITLALLEEAVNPGIFQEKLTKSCEQNNIPKVNYTLQPNTATAFYNTLCGAATQIPIVKQHLHQSKPAGTPQQNNPRAGKEKPHIISVNTGNITQPKTSKWLYTVGGKRNLAFDDTNSIELTSREADEIMEKRPRKRSPLAPTGKITSKTQESGGKGRESIDTLWQLDKLRETLDDTSLIFFGKNTNEAKKLGSILEKKITIKALHEMLGIVTLHNDREWVKSLHEKLEHLISKGLGEHLVPYKAKITSPKNATGQQKNFFNKNNRNPK